MLRERLYPCNYCSWKFPASPPDDVSTIAMVEQCECKKATPRAYECPNCNNYNTLYWHKPTFHEAKERVIEVHLKERVVPDYRVIPSGMLITEDLKGIVQPSLGDVFFNKPHKKAS